MYQILTLNKISATGLDRLPAEQYTHGNEIAQPDAIMVRSASMHEMEMPASLKAIARAGAGTNNIDIKTCTEKVSSSLIHRVPIPMPSRKSSLPVCCWHLVISMVELPGQNTGKQRKFSQGYGKTKEKICRYRIKR